MENIKKTDIAYVAGVIDSDGTIYIDRFRNKKRNAQLYTYVLRVKVCQSDLGTIEWLTNVFGGKYRKYHYKREGAYNKKSLYIWQINSQKAGFLLKKLFPYLKIKKRQAELGVKYAQVASRHKKGFPLTENERKTREQFAVDMRLLNQRKA